MSEKPVVVGVDGSARGLAAVEWATAEAVLRHRPLRVVHALIWVPANLEPAAAPAAHEAYWKQAGDYVADAVGLARMRAPELPVSGEVVAGSAVAVMTAESGRAGLLVVGDRGLSPLTELLIGSVAIHAAVHGRCPVLVVRGGRRPDGPVVVGVDGSAASTEALWFAAEEADLRGTELVALHAWHGDPGTELTADLTTTGEFFPGAAQERRVLAESLAGIAAKYPDLRVTRQVRQGHARDLLTEWSHVARLVVVGSRGHGGLAGALLGSVGRHLLHHAAAPVAIVRPAGDRA
jgi:nucleotide-binding universal stress UspA family protein